MFLYLCLLLLQHLPIENLFCPHQILILPALRGHFDGHSYIQICKKICPQHLLIRIVLTSIANVGYSMLNCILIKNCECQLCKVGMLTRISLSVMLRNGDSNSGMGLREPWVIESKSVVWRMQGEHPDSDLVESPSMSNHPSYALSMKSSRIWKQTGKHEN